MKIAESVKISIVVLLLGILLATVNSCVCLCPMGSVNASATGDEWPPLSYSFQPTLILP